MPMTLSQELSLWYWGCVMPSCFKQDWVKSRRRGHPDDAEYQPQSKRSELNTTDITANSGKRWLVPEKQDNEQIKARSARIFNYFGAFQFLTLSQKEMKKLSNIMKLIVSRSELLQLNNSDYSNLV